MDYSVVVVVPLVYLSLDTPFFKSVYASGSYVNRD